MTQRCKQLVLVLALAVMPLQGIAATLSSLFCHGEAQAHSLHDRAGHDHGLDHGSPPDESGNADHAIYHLCCNLSVSAPLTATPEAIQSRLPVRPSVPDRLQDLFSPEQPQRPPLA